MSEITLFNRWTVKRKYFWIGLGLIPVLCIVVVFIMMLFPTVGSVYNDVGYSLEAPQELGFGGGVNESAESYAYDGDFEAEAPREVIVEDKAFAGVDTATASANGAVVVDRLIIREGTVSIYAERTRQTRDDIEGLVQTFVEEGAYVISASESSRGEGKEPRITMAIRVPVDQFDFVMDAIADMAVEVINSDENAQDVTEEYVDLEGRIDALEAARDRLMEIMSGAEFTEDLLMAEEQLTMREAELESLYGRLNYLSESARLSRIYIDLQPYELYEPIDTSWKPAQTFRNAVEDLIDGMQSFADFMIRFAIVVLPWLVFFGLIIWGVVAVIRSRRSEKQAEK